MPEQLQRQEVQVFSTSGGINNRHRPWFLAENQIADNKGWDTSIDGQRRKREGMKAIWGNDGAPRGMYFWDNARRRTTSIPDPIEWASYNAIIACVGNTVKAIKSDGSEETITSSPTLGGFDMEFHPAAEHYVNLSGEKKRAVYFVNAYEHHTDISNAAEAFFVIDNDTVWNFATSGVPPKRPRCAAFLQGRLWIGNDQITETGPSGFVGNGGTGDWFYGSDLWPSDLYDSGFTHQAILIEPGLGGNLVALWPIRDPNPALICFKNRAICLFEPRWGEGGVGGFMALSSDTLDTVNSKIRVLSSTIGCASQRTVREVPLGDGTDIWFLASDMHVRSIKRVEQDEAAGAGSAISWLQVETMRRINRRFAHKAVAAVWEDKYFLSVPLGTATQNTHTLIFDTFRRTLMAIEPWPFTGLQTGAGLVNSSDGTYLYGQWLDSTTDCSFTGAFTGFSIFRLYDEASYLDPDGQNISAQEETAAFHFGDLKRKKKWRTFTLMVEADTQASGTLSIDYACDCAQFTALGSVDIVQGQAGSRHLYRQSFGLDDIDPSYILQFRIKEDTAARLSVLYTEVEARLIPAEQDNAIT